MTDTHRVVFLVALAGVVLASVAVGTVAGQSAPDCSAVSYTGDGTEANPYEVGDVDQLQCIEEQDLGANYVQVSDIDASGTSAWNGGKGFEPIGGFSNQFNGSFNGRIYNITNLEIDRGSEDNLGVFAFVDIEGTVTDVGVVNAYINGSSDVGGLVSHNDGAVRTSYATGEVRGGPFVGGLVALNSGTISDSYAAGSVNGSISVGGLVGDSNGMISDSYSTAAVEGSSDRVGGSTGVGGLVGSNLHPGTISDSYATGTVDGNRAVGGLIGGNGGTVERSYATGNVSGLGDKVGGLFGTNGGTVRESHANGTVSGNDDVGGLVGNNGRGGTARESYATGDVSGSGINVGGLFGRNSGNVTESYVIGDVSGDDRVGGLIGFNEEGNVTESYANGSVSGDEDVGGLIGQNGDINDEGTVRESYATGDVSGNIIVGGLVGVNGGTVTESYWDTQSTGQSTSDGGTGLTTSEMTGSAATSNMLGFDFTSTWETVTDPDDYPTLAFQTEDDLFTDALPGFNNPPTNTGALDPALYEDIDGDGDGTDPTQAVTLWTELVVNSGNFDGLTQEQIDALDWNGDGQLTPADAVSLWTEQVLA